MNLSILGIETSCDETSVAVVTSERQILSQVVVADLEIHQKYGGVVPEVAARAHLGILDTLIRQALCEAGLGWSDIQGVAATAGPGLIGGLVVGVTTAKALSLALDIPFLAVNHLAGHALTARLTHNVLFPYLLLLVSGGHCQLMVVMSPLDYRILGETLDDAVGEAFDKVAKILGLPYPGGPHVERLAQTGNPDRFLFPRPLVDRKEEALACSFSFSGLKTAVKRTVDLMTQKGSLTDQDRADCAASFQHTVTEILKNRVSQGINLCRQHKIPLTACVVAGGVAANQGIRQVLKSLADHEDLPFVAPPVSLCTDNGAMIAWMGLEKMRLGKVDSLYFKPRPRWPLIELGEGKE